jgi:hypothetical protein
MLKHALTHSTHDDDDPDTIVFYEKLVDLIDQMTRLTTEHGNFIRLEYDDSLESLTLSRANE